MRINSGRLACCVWTFSPLMDEDVVDGIRRKYKFVSLPKPMTNSHRHKGRPARSDSSAEEHLDSSSIPDCGSCLIETKQAVLKREVLSKGSWLGFGALSDTSKYYYMA